MVFENARLYAELRTHADELEARVARRTLALREEKERVEAILNSTSDAVLLISREGRVNEANHAFSELFGYERDRVIGQQLTFLFPPDEHEAWDAALSQLRENQNAIRKDLTAVRIDGVRLAVEVAFAPFHTDISNFTVCSIRDISGRKQAEETLRIAYEQERELRALKSRFIAIVSHEFRNPLSVISISASMLRRYLQQMDEATRDRHVETIQSQIDHMTALLEDVLALESTEGSGRKLVLAQVDIQALCREIVEGLRRSFGVQRVINLQYETSSTPIVYGDATLLRLLITNLISNALKYSPEDRPVHVTLTSEDAGLVFTVRDEGIGIPPEDQKRLFTAFYRAGNTGDTPGTGLGLVITQKAVEMLGGSIRFESTENVGTEFSVTLPLKTEDNGEDRQDVSNSSN